MRPKLLAAARATSQDVAEVYVAEKKMTVEDGVKPLSAPGASSGDVAEAAYAVAKGRVSVEEAVRSVGTNRSA